MDSIGTGQGPQDARPPESLQSASGQFGDQHGMAPTSDISHIQEHADVVSAASQPTDASPSATAVAAPQFDLASLQTTLATLSDDRLLMVLMQLPAYQLARALECLLKPESDTPCVPQVQSAADLEQVSESDPADNRRADRSRVFRAGKIIYNNNLCVSDCHIRDLSSSGCRVVLESLYGIPDHFTLHILTADSKHECEVAWRKSNMMGLKFIA